MGQTNIRTLTRHGDVELYFAAGEGWRLPLFVNWEHDKENDLHFATLTQGCGFYHTQLLVINALLSAHNISGRQDAWVIPRRSVEALLHKAPGITATAYYAWPDDAMPPLPLPAKVTKLSVDTGEISASDFAPQARFIEHLAKEYSLPSSIIRIVLKAIGAEAAGWMMRNRLPLELGFCRLIAVPFRANWKEIVAFKLKKWKLLGMLNLPSEKKFKELEWAGLPETLCSPDNIAMTRGNNSQIQYSIEAIPSKAFEAAAYKVESERQACGRSNYVATFETSVRELYPYLLQALETYLKKACAPFARVIESRRPGVLGFSPTRGVIPKVHGVGLRSIPVTIVGADSNFSVFGAESGNNRVSAKTAPVRQVPNLLPEASDLRNGHVNGAVDGQGREAEADRLLVLDAGQGQNEVGDMLPPRSWRDDGLD